jgi:hypothetical protein
MAIASGVAKKLSYIKETTWGTRPANSATWKYLRRVTSDIDVAKDTYQSNEIRTDYQIADFRHGSRRVQGAVRGEMSPGTYSPFVAAALRQDFGTLADLTGITVTYGTTTDSRVYTLTRSAGSWLSGTAPKVGQVVRVTAGSGVTANNNKNMFVVDVGTTILSVVPYDLTITTGTGTSITLNAPGKRTFVPASSHTNDSFSIEHWFSDIAQSESFTGCRVASVDISLPATGMATIDVGFLGKDVTTATSQFSSSSSAATSTGVLAAVNGAVYAGGAVQGVLTALSLRIDGGMNVGQVVGSNYTPDVFAGRVNVSGQFTAYFENATMRDAFLNETQIGLSFVGYTGSSATSDFIAISVPAIKLSGATKSDGEQGITLTCPFQAIYNSAGGTAAATEATTIWVQDSQA